MVELVNDKSKREYFGQKIYDVAKEHFDIVKVASKWERVFNEL